MKKTILVTFFRTLLYLGIPTCQILGRKDRRSRWLQFTVGLARLELWTIPNNWRTNCPQTSQHCTKKVQNAKPTKSISIHTIQFWAPSKLPPKKFFLWWRQKKGTWPYNPNWQIAKKCHKCYNSGKKKNLEKPHPSLKDKKKRFEFSPFENSFNFHIVFEFSYLFFIGDDFWLF